MSDATDVTEDTAAGHEERPSFLPPPTFPAAMLTDEGAGGEAAAETAPPPVAGPPDEAPARPGLLIRLGRRLCGPPNGAR